jgi:hypothetical protein
LAVARHLPAGRSRAGDRHLNFHDYRDNLGDRLAGSLSRFVGHDGYDVNELRSDLSRFAFLLGGNDGELLFGGG